MSAPTVVVADDHHIVRDAVKRLLTAADAGLPCEVVAEADNGLAALVAVREHSPDFLILDISMPLATGSEIIADVRHWSPETKILVFTGMVGPAVLAGVVTAGAQGVFSKSAPLEVLMEKLPLILNGGQYIAPELVAAIDQGNAFALLTNRETQTLNMIIRGRSSKDMADSMNISTKTIEKHRASLMRKLGARSTAELLARALQDGLIEPN